jgi:hypothetical protein
MFPPHGPIVCRKCFEVPDQPVRFFDGDQFRLLPPPGAYGAQNPRVAVLGMTYGSTQNRVGIGNFDEKKAFAGFRPRLDRLLKRVGVFAEGDTCDAKIKATETEFAFGSALRCSLMGKDVNKGKYSSESTFVVPAFAERKAASVTLKNCFDVHLRNLAPRLKLVILLGNSPSYVAAIRRQLMRMFGSDYKKLGKKAHYAEDRYWVHLTHASKGNYAYFDKYLDDPDHYQQGPVREEAIKYIRMSGWVPDNLGSVNRHHRSGDQMSAEQPKTLSEQRADYVRQLHDLETRKNGTITISSDEHPPTAEDRVRQIERMKNAIAQIDEALVR